MLRWESISISNIFLGNAAGLLARRGMMMGSQRSGIAPVYSDDDSDSDTEEYISNVHK